MGDALLKSRKQGSMMQDVCGQQYPGQCNDRQKKKWPTTNGERARHLMDSKQYSTGSHRASCEKFPQPFHHIKVGRVTIKSRGVASPDLR